MIYTAAQAVNCTNPGGAIHIQWKRYSLELCDVAVSASETSLGPQKAFGGNGVGRGVGGVLSGRRICPQIH